MKASGNGRRDVPANTGMITGRGKACFSPLSGWPRSKPSAKTRALRGPL